MKPVERRLLGLVARSSLAVLAVLAAGQGVLLIVQAELLAQAIAGLDAGPLPWLLAAAVLRGGLGWTSQRVAAGTAAAVKTGLRGSLLAAPAGPAGERLALVTRGLDALDAFFTGYLPQLFLAAIVPVLVLGRLAFADWPSALLVLVVLPLIPVFGALVGMRTADLTRHQWSVLERLGGHFRDVLAGLSTLRAHARIKHQSKVIGDMADAHRRATGSVLRVAFLSSLVLELVASVSVALVAVPVGLRLLDGSLVLATGLLVLLLTPEAFLPLRALGMRFHASSEGIAAASQVFDVLDAPAPHVLRAGGARPSGGAPHLVIEDLEYRYPGASRPAFSGLNLEVRPGERVALAGPSGAGKSTLLRVVLGLLAPTKGRVLVDGVDLRELDPASWRAALAWVPQHPRLFAATIAANLELGLPPTGRDELRAAAVEMGADGFVSALPDGYDTVLGERGAGLSAGQRQRLALTRARLRDAPLVLLDEPTAHLDLATEAALLPATGALLEGRTALMVAHRPAMLARADRVVRLSASRLEGRLDERGVLGLHTASAADRGIRLPVACPKGSRG
ncbi:hypothetical protein GCM10010439_72380 [Actinocorallia aurantiaca]|uniref:ATP-binding cassette subfamily C protein CydD n=1 Tax=Actinocorallia aurantiaca TaxID=46204 RepID=A0ABN3UU98_9ACTN